MIKTVFFCTNQDLFQDKTWKHFLLTLYGPSISPPKPKLMTKKFMTAGLVTTAVLFLLNGIAYAAVLKNVFHSYPALSEAFANQLYRADNDLIWWAVICCSIAIGFLVTTVIKWSGARTFTAGLKSGLIFGFLFLCSVDLGLYGSTYNFTLTGALADIVCSTSTITISSAIAAWLLGRGKKKKTEQFSIEKQAIEVS